jgi:hypothetical protein
MAVMKWRNKLEEARKEKGDVLDQKCKETIQGRFSCEVDGVTYSFSNDSEAQANFADAKSSWIDGDILPEDTLPWTAYDADGNVVRLQLNKAQFDPVNRTRMQWKLTCISRYRDELMPMVDAATAPEDLDNIVW